MSKPWQAVDTLLDYVNLFSCPHLALFPYNFYHYQIRGVRLIHLPSNPFLPPRPNFWRTQVIFIGPPANFFFHFLSISIFYFWGKLRSSIHDNHYNVFYRVFPELWTSIFLFQCEPFCVSSCCLVSLRKKCTGCICMVFLQCGSKYDISMIDLWWLNSYIVCIFLSFLRYDSAYVCSDNQLGRMTFYIDHKYTASLQCEGPCAASEFQQ